MGTSCIASILTAVPAIIAAITALVIALRSHSKAASAEQTATAVAEHTGTEH